MFMFKFIDLFSGIGGFHLALSNLGSECVFASEIDKFARKTYEQNFKNKHPQLFKSGMFNDNILNVNPADIPEFDIMCAGFPCQPFSIIGKKKGFEETKNYRGNMFYVLVDIIKHHRPKALFLENVQNLKAHDNGKTFETIKNIIEDELNYELYYKIVKASDYGLPQLRPRIFLVAFRKEDTHQSQFNFPAAIPLKFTMSDVWEGKCDRDVGYTLRTGGRGSGVGDKHNWDGYIVDGVERRLGVKEGKKMMGLPDDFVFPVSNTQAMKQLGNGVAVDAVQAVAKEIIEHLKRNL